MVSASDDAYHNRISPATLEQLLSVKGEGDAWDFKETLGTDTKAKVNLAKDALALCNVPGGGSLVVGVTKDYRHVGLTDGEHVDTTKIHDMIDKYIDGEYALVAAEHELTLAEDAPKRFGIIYFRRRTAQPVLAARNGDLPEGSPLFRTGDILIRRGAASVRANSGDVRQLLTSSVVNEERVKAVNELWTALVEQRRLLRGMEFLYDILADTEYDEVMNRQELRASLGQLTQTAHAQSVDELHTRVRLVRPYLDDEAYGSYYRASAFLGRLQMKTIENRDKGNFRSWTLLNDGSEDGYLKQIADGLLPSQLMTEYWRGSSTDMGTWRPLARVLDATEATVFVQVRSILSGLT